MNKNIGEKNKWLVAVKVPKEKSLWMRLCGYSPNEIFGFPKKNKAQAFILEMEKLGCSCLIAKA
jgi:hypothetical protein